MEEEEAKKYGFRLSRVVSITSLLDELKSKDSEAWDSTKTLESWVNEPVAEEAHEEDDKADHLERNAEHKTVNKHRATLNFSTGVYFCPSHIFCYLPLRHCIVCLDMYYIQPVLLCVFLKQDMQSYQRKRMMKVKSIKTMMCSLQTFL